MSTIEWDFDDDVVQGPSEREYHDAMARYNAPIEKHTCDRSCKDRVIENYHETEEVFDDFNLSQKQRETMRMEVISSRGRDNKESRLIRMFVGVNDGLFYLRMQTVSALTSERIGDIIFETKPELEEYYNYAIDVFRFSKSLKIVPAKYEDLFSALDDDDDDLFGGLDEDEDNDPFSDLDDDDDQGLWD